MADEKVNQPDLCRPLAPPLSLPLSPPVLSKGASGQLPWEHCPKVMRDGEGGGEGRGGREGGGGGGGRGGVSTIESRREGLLTCCFRIDLYRI